MAVQRDDVMRCLPQLPSQIHATTEGLEQPHSHESESNSGSNSPYAVAEDSHTFGVFDREFDFARTRGAALRPNHTRASQVKSQVEWIQTDKSKSRSQVEWITTRWESDLGFTLSGLS